MNIVTVSREFGSGGRELGRKLADILGYEYYDKEIFAALANDSGYDSDSMKTLLSTHDVKSYPVSTMQSYGGAGLFDLAGTDLMIQQKKIVEMLPSLGKDFVVIGRNADVILEEYKPLNIFVCADMEAKIERCLASSHRDADATEKSLEKMLRKMDKSRARTREIMTDKAWGDPHSYHLTVNTSGRDLDQLADFLAGYAREYFRF